jgi:putative transposase
MRAKRAGNASPLGDALLDFVADTLDSGRHLRILVIVDDFTRECLALVVDTSLSGMRVARELDRLIVERGRPLMIISDNDTIADDPAVGGAE